MHVSFTGIGCTEQTKQEQECCVATGSVNIAWHAGIQFGGSRAVYFEGKVDPEVFHNMFSSYEHFYEGSKKGSPSLYAVRLDRDELIAAFGKVTTAAVPVSRLARSALL